MIKYELKPIITRGVLKTEQPILVSDRNLILSFDIENPQGQYFVALTDQIGKISTFSLEDFKVKLPEILIKNQSLKVRVINILNGKVHKQWDCQALRLTLLDDLIKTSYECSFDYNDLQEQYSRLLNDINSLAETSILQSKTIQNLQTDCDIKTNQITELERKLNEAIGAINNLSERVEFMENNYNPLEV